MCDVSLDLTRVNLVEVSPKVSALDFTQVSWCVDGSRQVPSYGGGKHITTWGMREQLQDDVVVVESSGGFGAATARYRMFSGRRTIVVVKHNLEQGKIDRIKESGGEVILAPAGTSPTMFGEQYANTNGYPFVNQYSASSPGNMEGHRDITGTVLQQLCLPQLEFLPKVIVAATGSGGTIMGLHRWLAAARLRDRVKLWAVRPEISERIPGARDKNGLKSVTQLDQSVVDGWYECSERAAYEASAQLVANGHYFGPSAGACFLASCEVLRNQDGVSVVFMAWDDPGAYINEYREFGLSI